MAPRHRRILRDNIMSIKDPQIKRLSYKAGIKRLKADVYDEVRGRLLIFLEKVLSVSIVLMKHTGRATLNLEDIKYGIEKVSKKFYGSGQAKKCKTENDIGNWTVKARPGQATEKYIKYYQKNSDCLLFTYEGFSRLAREVAQDFGANIRWTKDATITLQEASETYLVNLLLASNIMAATAGREGVGAKDIKLAVNVKEVLCN